MQMEFLFPLFAFILTYKCIPLVSEKFLSAGLFGIDVNKEKRPQIPEGLGVVAGAIYLYTLIIQLPFPQIQFSMALSGMLSICCMLLLGFCDDVLELKWIFKIGFPVFASFPLVFCYISAGGTTSVLVPRPLKEYFGNSFDLGHSFYIYMIALTLFCTNSINIYAGINGLEVGQSIIIAFSMLIYNLIQLFRQNDSSIDHSIISIYFLIPFVVISMALFIYNRYPARIFVGDSYCYFAGMVFSCAGILGHYGKTLLLFLIPQFLNFLFSSPQIFGIFPCPRHRLPLLNSTSNCLEPSNFQIHCPNEDGYPSSSSYPVAVKLIFLLSKLKIVKITQIEQTKDAKILHVSNFTLINAFLCYFGPMHEKKLLVYLLCFQALCSIMAFFIRFYASYILY